MPRTRVPEGVHPDSASLVPLLGTWRGRGEGSYPGVSAFAYEEEVSFVTSGARFLTYRQHTRNVETGAGMHAEAGFWRPVLPDRVEVVIAQPTGLAEVYEGTVDGGRYELRSTAIARTTTAKRVEIMERTLRVRADVLTYSVRMSAMGHPLLDHLVAELRRVD